MMTLEISSDDVFGTISFLTAPGWSVDELWWSDLNVMQVIDNDTTTCLEFKNGDPVLTLLQKAPLRNSFIVDIVLGNSHHHAAIRVLTSETEPTSCSQPNELKKCKLADDNKYHCFCELHCQIYVKLLLMFTAIAVDNPLQFCEIYVIN